MYTSRVDVYINLGGCKSSTADFLVNMFNRIKLRIQGLDRVQSPLLTRPVEQVARPGTVACLCCRGWVGVRAQGFFFQVTSGLARAQRNRIGVGLPICHVFLGLFWSGSVHFSEVSQFEGSTLSHARTARAVGRGRYVYF